MIDFSEVTEILYNNTLVEQIADSHGNVLWSAAPVVLHNYFYVEDASGEANTFRINKSNSTPSYEVFGSTDQENWSSLGYTGDNIQVPLPANSKLYIYVTRPHWHSESTMWEFDAIGCTGLFNVGGNIMSLLNGSNFEGTSFTSENWSPFSNLMQFQPVVDASNLILPNNTVDYCYSSMFRNCESLTTPPALPATTMTDYCYTTMFYGCTSLTTAPALPATTLAQQCYNAMFGGCTSLTTAPELPATTLAQNCYASMFGGCTSLTTAPSLPATTLAQSCYAYMFGDCTSLTTAPTLPATTLVQGCYAYMFGDCTNLSTVTTYADNISASGCLDNWLYNVASQGNFNNYGSAVYPSGASGIPTGWTEHNS